MNAARHRTRIAVPDPGGGTRGNRPEGTRHG